MQKDATHYARRNCAAKGGKREVIRFTAQFAWSHARQSVGGSQTAIAIPRSGDRGYIFPEISLRTPKFCDSCAAFVTALPASFCLRRSAFPRQRQGGSRSMVITLSMPFRFFNSLLNYGSPGHFYHAFAKDAKIL